jgi:YVTN family beta-propeller protein
MNTELLRNNIAMQDGDTLLDYSIRPAPNPLQASIASVTDVATLTLIVSNGGHPVACTNITVSVLVGTNAKDLVTSAAGITTERPNDWSIAQSGGTFTLTPNTPEAGRIGSDGVTFTFGNVTINTEVGTTLVTIDELASSISNPLQDRTGTISLAKFPPQFTLSDLSVDPTEVGSGGGATLFWDGSPATYLLKFNPGSGEQDVPVSHTGHYPATNLTHDPVVVFTLVVTYTDQGQDQPVIAQKAAFVTVDPLPPVVTSFTATVRDQQAAFTWTSQNALSCSMSAWPNLLKSAGSLGHLAIDRMRFSMVANASKLTSAPANADLTFSIVTQSTVIPQPCQAWRFHRTSDGSMLVVVANSERDPVVAVAVVDTATLTVRNSATFPGDDYGLVTTLSPDGRSLLFNAYQQGAISALATVDIPAIVLDLVEIDPLTFDQDSATFSPDGQKVFVTYSQPPFPTRVLSASTLELERSFNLPSCGPCAVSPDGTRFYVAGDKVFVIVDAASGAILGQPELGSEISNGLAMNELGTIVYVNGANGIVSVVDTAAMQVIQQIPTGSTGAGKSTGNGIVIGPSGGEVYVADPASNSVIAIDATTFTVIGKIALPESPVDLVFGTGSIMQLYVLGLSGIVYKLEATGPV